LFFAFGCVAVVVVVALHFLLVSKLVFLWRSTFGSSSLGSILPLAAVFWAVVVAVVVDADVI